MAINVNGVFYFCRAVVPHMREHKYGRIVNIASIAGKEGNPNMIAYSGSKAAVIGMTKSLGKEVATDGICVNAVSPAVVRTTILEQLTPQQITYMTDKIPMRRTGEPWRLRPWCISWPARIARLSRRSATTPAAAAPLIDQSSGPMAEIRIGTSGWHYKHWVGTFYPPDGPPRRCWPGIRSGSTPSNSTTPSTASRPKSA